MDTIRETMREIAADRYPGAPTFWVKAAEDNPGMRMKAGDLVICARTQADPGDMAVVEGNGKIVFIRCDPGEEEFHNVVFAVIRELGR